MQVFTFYTTDGCHLCEKAINLIQKLASEGIKMEVYLEDIAESEQLVEDYGIRIPVIKHDASGEELGWPFDEAQLRAWLYSRNQTHK